MGSEFRKTFEIRIGKSALLDFWNFHANFPFLKVENVGFSASRKENVPSVIGDFEGTEEFLPRKRSDAFYVRKEVFSRECVEIVCEQIVKIFQFERFGIREKYPPRMSDRTNERSAFEIENPVTRIAESRRMGEGSRLFQFSGLENVEPVDHPGSEIRNGHPFHSRIEIVARNEHPFSPLIEFEMSGRDGRRAV